MKTYLSLYYLVQFCGHSWIFTNMIARFFSFGKESVETHMENAKEAFKRLHKNMLFAKLGKCQFEVDSVSFLRFRNTAKGIEIYGGSITQMASTHKDEGSSEVTERLIILFVVITSQEEVQGKYVVCILFFLWNLWDVTRYTYGMLSSMEIEFPVLTWLSHTLWIPAYPLSVLCEAYTIYESLPYFETLGTYSFEMPVPIDCSVHFPYILKAYLVMMPIGMLFLCSHLYSERKIHISGSNYKAKKKSD